MSVRNQILEDIKTAMKSRDSQRSETLRFLNAAIKNREIELRPSELKEEDVLGVIKKSAKQRRESIEEYSKAGRQDLVEKEKAELAIIEHYLPQQLGRPEVEKLVADVIQALGAKTIKDMGSVMKEVTARAKGAADNKLVSELVRAKLQA